MNCKLFEKRLRIFLSQFSSNEQKISALKEVIRQSPQGKKYRRYLCKGFSKDAVTDTAIVDVCNEWINNLSQMQQLTIFDALAGGMS